MGRRERPLPPGPLHDFAGGLRKLREQAGLTYRALSRVAGYSASALSAAASGNSLPTVEVLRAYVRGCGGDIADWEDRWRQLAAELRRTQPGLLTAPSGLAPLAGGDPAQIGPVALVARLGEGAMGQVYLGRGAGGEPLAVKLIRAELAADAGFRGRFRREFHALAKARSPFIAPVTAGGPDGERPWLAIPYIPAVTLAEAVTFTGPLPSAAAGQLAAAVAAALLAMHAVGIVHRDLKPSNVLLTTDSVHVIDFGVAHMAESAGLTATGTHVGTAAYMAPEQATGELAGPATDVFALGSLLVYALTGFPPFGQDRTEALLYRVIHSPPDLAALDALSGQDDILGNLRELISACLTKDPEGRPAPATIPGRYPAALRLPEPGWLPPPAAELINSRAASAAAALSTLPAAPPPVTSFAPPPTGPTKPQRWMNRPAARRARFWLPAAILAGAIVVSYAIGRAAGSAHAPTSPPAATSVFPPSQVVAGTRAIRPAAGTGIPAAARQAAPNDTIGCDDHQSIRSAENGRWVSTELGYGTGLTAMLRARSQVIGPWEKYALCYDYTRSFWYIVSDANNAVVSVELSYTGSRLGMLRARNQIVGPWEEYNLYCTSSRTLIIQSNASQLWVSAEFGYTGGSTGMLRARAEVLGPWEQYATASKKVGC